MNISKEQLQHYRSETFRTRPGLRVNNPNEAVAYVNQRGYIFFWPIKNIIMPSLWVAAAGDRPVPDAHDDPGHKTWDWKDKLLGKGKWYYGRVLRKRNMMISLDMLPYFYALSPNYGDPNEDYLIDYEEGRLTAASKNMYEALLKQGPLDTIALRKYAGLTNQSAQSEFNRALDELQSSFRILPVGVSDAGAWHYAFIYDIVSRHFPDLDSQSRPITEPDARQKIIACYVESLGAVPFKEIHRVFGYQPVNWPSHVTERDLRKMEERGEIIQGAVVEGIKEPCVVSPRMASV